MFYKSSIFFFFFFFNFLFMTYNYSYNFCLSCKYFSIFMDFFFNFGLSIQLNFFVLCFIFMVMLVMFMVSCYSSFYLDFYNNKKFFFLMIFFFFCMLIFCISSSPALMLLGWDGLGFSSILLVMFYPNFTSFYNSYLTMFFNRLGDVFILVFFCTFFLFQFNYFFISSIYSPLFLFFGVLCSFTKSAQMPFSSWLPSAMSAPTPISAMVHSSTLVTAGLFFFLVFYDIFFFFGLTNFFILFSVLTFVLGGLGANLDFDLKKMVAFSTMSQISMIFFFLSSGSFYLGLFHMIGHAFFKTLIFLCCGTFFIHMFSNQIKILSGSHSGSNILKFYFFFSVFCMSGLYFSTSFYSKDMLLELFNTGYTFFFMFFLIFGGVLTIFYSSLLFSLLFFWLDLKKSFYFKFHGSYSFFFLFGFMFFFEVSFLIFMDFFPFVSLLDLFLINLIFISSFFFYFFKGFIIFNLSKMTFLSKSFFFSFLKKNFSHFNGYFLNDHFFFKPVLLVGSSTSFFYKIFFNYCFFSTLSSYFFFLLFISLVIFIS